MSANTVNPPACWKHVCYHSHHVPVSHSSCSTPECPKTHSAHVAASASGQLRAKAPDRPSSTTSTSFSTHTTLLRRFAQLLESPAREQQALVESREQRTERGYSSWEQCATKLLSQVYPAALADPFTQPIKLMEQIILILHCSSAGSGVLHTGQKAPSSKDTAEPQPCQRLSDFTPGWSKQLRLSRAEAPLT